MDSPITQLTVRVQPGARRSGYVGWYGGQPKLAVATRPVGGAVTVEALRIVAGSLCPRQR